MALQSSLIHLVARGGFEPPLPGPKPGVLPLDDRAKMPFLNGCR